MTVCFSACQLRFVVPLAGSSSSRTSCNCGAAGAAGLGDGGGGPSSDSDGFLRPGEKGAPSAPPPLLRARRFGTRASAITEAISVSCCERVQEEGGPAAPNCQTAFSSGGGQLYLVARSPGRSMAASERVLWGCWTGRGVPGHRRAKRRLFFGWNRFIATVSSIFRSLRGICCRLRLIVAAAAAHTITCDCMRPQMGTIPQATGIVPPPRYVSLVAGQDVRLKPPVVDVPRSAANVRSLFRSIH
eukprot:COSAG06_NODE_2709_length_6406_cov_86.599968_4_plen_244_part_00